jgi:hypothetical protein
MQFMSTSEQKGCDLKAIREVSCWYVKHFDSYTSVTPPYILHAFSGVSNQIYCIGIVQQYVHVIVMMKENSYSTKKEYNRGLNLGC